MHTCNSSIWVVLGRPCGPGALGVGSGRRSRIWTCRDGEEKPSSQERWGPGKDSKVVMSVRQGGLGFLEVRMHEGKESWKGKKGA